MRRAFSVKTTAHFDRAFQKLASRHPRLAAHYARAIEILGTDPYNQSRTYPIKKLEGVAPPEGQYRVRLGQFRLRYDVEDGIVYLKSCALRREDTYR